jgi:hypothetical protein
MNKKNLTSLALAGLLLTAGSCGRRRTEPAPSAPIVPETTLPGTTAHAVETAETRPQVRDTGDAPAPAIALPSDVLKVYPEARRLDSTRTPFPHVVVLSASGSALGYVVDSDSAGTTARGYAGPVPLRLFLDQRGRPRRIYVLDNSETPAYLELATGSGLLDRLLSYDPARPDSIDAVTLATMSSRAIIAGVTATCRRTAAEVAKSCR